MSLLKLVPAWLHAIGDYGAGLVLLFAGLFADASTEARATGIVLGAGLIVVSLFTRYPLGAIRVIPFPVHSFGDYLGGALAILAPFVLDFRDEDSGLSALYIVVGAVVVILSLVTNYSWGPDEQFASLDSNRSMAHS
jgi:hypothetical protein